MSASDVLSDARARASRGVATAAQEVTKAAKRLETQLEWQEFVNAIDYRRSTHTYQHPVGMVSAELGLEGVYELWKLVDKQKQTIHF